MRRDVHDLESILGVTFRDEKLLLQALTHRSYLNEHRGLKMDHNERLEFLGDAVLELVVTDYLFKKYPDKTEGDLTAYRAALVNTVVLSSVAQNLGVNDHLLLSRGEAKDTGRARQYILANAFESLIGALYLDQGYEAARLFIERHLLPKIDEIVAKKLWQDAKSYFQEKAQDQFGLTPSYSLISEEGPDHDKRFVIGLYVGKEFIAEGEGRSKQEAEQDAARRGVVKKGW